jgi:hypothetical protein
MEEFLLTPSENLDDDEGPRGLSPVKMSATSMSKHMNIYIKSIETDLMKLTQRYNKLEQTTDKQVSEIQITHLKNR